MEKEVILMLVYIVLAGELFILAYVIFAPFDPLVFGVLVCLALSGGIWAGLQIKKRKLSIELASSGDSNQNKNGNNNKNNHIG